VNAAARPLLGTQRNAARITGVVLRAPRLGALQGWLLDVVTDPSGVSEGVIRAAENHPSLRTSDAASLVEGGRMFASERLAVYRNGYFARLVECLADDYPSVSHALGNDRFETLCKDFIDAHPPSSSSLNDYGAPFASYCATRPEPWRAVITELARLEWALVSAIHADAERVLEAEDLARLGPDDWQRVRLRPSAALRVLSFDYPVNRYYGALNRGDDPRLPSRRRKHQVAVCRKGADLWRLPLDARLTGVLSALCAGRTLSQALGVLTANDDDDIDARLLQRVRVALRDWVSCGFFAGLG
jgi:hypothetical protein